MSIFTDLIYTVPSITLLTSHRGLGWRWNTGLFPERSAVVTWKQST